MKEEKKGRAQKIAGVVHRNIKKMLHLRRQAEERKGVQYRIANSMTRRIGSLKFACLQIAFTVAWVVLNAGWIHGLKAFDPYPFPLFATIISVEAILSAIFILMNQNQMAELSKKREELDIQISLLTEHEVTKVIDLVDRISRHLSVKGATQDISDLKAETSPEKVLQVIEREIGIMEGSSDVKSETGL